MLDLAKEVNVMENKPRICSRQTNRSNPPSEDTHHIYYELFLFLLLIMLYLVLQIDFDTSITAYHGLVFVPSKLLHFKYAKTAVPWTQQFHKFLNFY